MKPKSTGVKYLNNGFDYYRLMTIRNVIVLIALFTCLGVIAVQHSSIKHLREENSKLIAINDSTALELNKVSKELNSLTDLTKVLKKELTVVRAEVSELKQLVARLSKEPYDITDLRITSNATLNKLNRKLVGTPLQGKGQAFLDAEAKYKINAYYILAHAMWESNRFKSKLAKTKHNLFGYMAFNEDSNSAASFSTYEECIDEVMAYVDKEYLTENGKWYSGAGLKDMNVNYAQLKDESPNWEWSEGIESIMAELAR